MSLSEKIAGTAQIFTAALAATAIFAITGCQVKPLYSTDNAAVQKLASIEISEARDRVEQQVRNRLIFLTSGGAGEPANAEYKLALDVTSQTKGVLFDKKADTASSGRIVIKGDFNLTRTSTGETVRSGGRTAVALVDFPNQEFAKVRAIRDGENRAANELAEIIRADLAAALGR